MDLFFKPPHSYKYYSCITSLWVSPVCYRHQLAPVLWEMKKIFRLCCLLRCLGTAFEWQHRVFQCLGGSAGAGTQECWGSTVLSLVACTPKRYPWGRLSRGMSLEQQSNTSTNTENHSSDTHLISCAHTSSSLRFSSMLSCFPYSCKPSCQGRKEWA